MKRKTNAQIRNTTEKAAAEIPAFYAKNPDLYQGRGYIAGVEEFIRTGQSTASQSESDHLHRRRETPSERWGLPCWSEFDEECEACEMASRQSGGLEGEGEIEEVAFTLHILLSALRLRVRQKSPAATRLLATLARDCTFALESVTGEARRWIREVAENSEFFPVLISNNTDLSAQKYIRGKLAELNVGANATMNPTGYDLRATESQIYTAALHEMCKRLHAVIDRERQSKVLAGWPDLPPWVQKARKLKALSHRTTRADAEAWWEVAWEALCAATGDHPETLAQFKDIGSYKKRAVKESSGRQHKFHNADQRGLNERLRRAWMARFAR